MKTDTGKARLLIVDDDNDVLETLRLVFEDSCEVLTASSGREAIDLAQDTSDIAVIIMDIRMARMDGIAAARAIRPLHPEASVIFYTGFPGDYDETEIDRNEQPYAYIRKGKSLPELKRTVRNAAERFQLRKDAAVLGERMQRDFGMVGRSKPMMQVFQTIMQVGPTDSKVMIRGETGTGKELVAKALHVLSERKDRGFGIVNCNHKTTELVEAELFGYKKGAFTGAHADRTGLFEFLNGGTVFLDEIGDLAVTTQIALLRVIETGEFTQIGPEAKLKKTDVRVLCATHRDLERLMERGDFREDLYQRLRGVTITLPPLRDRKEDIPLLVEAFLETHTVAKGQWPRMLDDQAMGVLMEYDWPRNVRELEETIRSVINKTASELILADDIARQLELTPESARRSTQSYAERLKECHRTLILEALFQTGFNVKAAAALLEMDRKTLHNRIKDLRIDLDSYRRR